MMLRRACVVAVLLLICQSANADWSLAGAQYSCSSEKGTFHILPDDESSDDSPGVIHEKKGFKKLADGISNLRCAIGPYKIKAQVNVMSPGNGECEGAGLVRIESISVDGVELLSDSPILDWACPGNPTALERVDVKALAKGVMLTQCFAKLDESGQPGVQACESKTTDVDTVAATNAKLDHDLADEETQIKESALRLPPAQDLANLGMSRQPKGVPLCAHWRDYFLGPILTMGGDFEPLRHGRIAGKKGDRVYIHPANPLLCDIQEDGCKSKSYVVPGDRVDVAFICGAWTLAQYESRIRSHAPIQGWIETAHLYAVDPVPEAWLKSPRFTQAKGSGFPSGSLMDAIAIGDTARVKKLVSAGASIKPPSSVGCPLSVAIEHNHIDMVKTLLDLGADPKGFDKNKTGGCVAPVASALDADDSILDLLILAGAEVNVPYLNSTPLIVSARWGLVPSQVLSDARSQESLRHHLQIMRRLLEASANPNVIDDYGKTALNTAIEKNNIDMVELLLQYGANPNIKSSLFEALDQFPIYWDSTVFQILIEHGANVNEQLEVRTDDGTYEVDTPLRLTAMLGSYNLTNYLLLHGADPDLAPDGEPTPADVAEKSGHPQVAELIRGFSARRKAQH